jgi:uncharacterized damage-inducible protein DinB
MGPLWIEAFRYNKWANLYLLDVCAKLTDEQLQLSAPGTYGTIAATFQHLVSGEEHYLRRVNRSEPRIKESDEFPGIPVLRDLAASSGDRLIAAAERVKPDDAIDTPGDDGVYRLNLGIVMIQALHHGNDHRTHICTILGHNGLTYGEMDVWAYGEAIGAIVPVASA